MRLGEFMEQVEGKNEVGVVIIDNRPIRVAVDADNVAGWVDILDLSSLHPAPKKGYAVCSTITIKTKRLHGVVEFRKILLKRHTTKNLK